MSDIAIPRGATLLAKRAQERGFAVRVMPSHGHLKGALVEHVAVRLRRGDALLAAFWEGSRFRSAVCVSPDAARLGSAEITALVDSDDLASDLAALLEKRRAKRDA